MSASDIAVFDRAQGSMLHRTSYEAATLVRSDHVCVGFTAYPRYPRQVITRPGFTAVVEGMIYDKDEPEIARCLERIVDSLGDAPSADLVEVRRFVDACDGEFLVAVQVPARRRVLVFNDAMSRLPAYVHHRPGVLAVSRELKFLLPHMDGFGADRDGVLEYLLFGFTFDRRTLVAGAGYLRPRSILVFDLQTGELAQSDGPPRNLEHTAWTNRAAAVAGMKNAFLESMRLRTSRLGGDRAVVSLSGGLDSRGTLAGLVASGTRPVAVTIEGPEQGYASRAAGALGVETRVLPKPKGAADFATVVFLKDGLDCHPGLEHLYRYPEAMQELLGEDIVYYTGIYGGEVTRYRNPTSSLGSTQGLVDYLLTARDYYKYSTERSCALVGVDVGHARRHLEEFIASFPETTTLRKYIHFRHHFDLKYAGEAEDRNRFFFWTVSPYFSERFFNAAMSLDENHKDTPLFRDFLHAVDPRTCDVPYFNFRMPMQPRFLLYGVSLAERLVRVPFFKSATRRGFAVLRRVKSMLRGGGADAASAQHMEELRREVRALLAESVAAAGNLDLSRAAQIVDTEQDVQGLERMRIVFAYLKTAEAWRSSLRASGGGLRVAASD